MLSDTVRQSDNFELLKMLGHGGFGETWLARVLRADLVKHFGTDKVVLKIPLNNKCEIVLRGELRVNATVIARRKSMAADNLVRFIDADHHGKYLVMVLEYVPGGDLRMHLENLVVSQVPVAETLRLSRGILEGLSILHGLQIVHRDVKPENVLLDLNRNPKVTDLGLSRLLQSNELAVSMAGTPTYMPPEQLEAQGLSYGADAWAVGVMMYEMLTGAHPFLCGSIGEVIRKICRDPLPSLHAVMPELPRPVADLVMRALVRDPAKRFANAGDMLTALDEVEAQLKLPFSPTPPPEPPLETRPPVADAGFDEALAAIKGLLRDNERTAEAQTALDALVAMYPHKPQAHLELAFFHGFCRLRAANLEALEQGRVKCPRSPEVLYHLAVAYKDHGQLDKALGCFNEAVRVGLTGSLAAFAKRQLNVLKAR
jgi:eukaryotic-like serine/threonine-protein kinase